jgi:hypothetical protein
MLALPVDVVPARQLDVRASTFLIDSSTAPPRSRPRTLYLAAVYRWFPSR